jgi:hypothetical protein
LHIASPSHSFGPDMNAEGSSAYRIRIGLTGLALAFLVIMLFSAVTKSSREDAIEAAANEEAPIEPSEPLAELGVAPGAGEAREAEAKAEAEAKVEAQRNAVAAQAAEDAAKPVEATRE